jgi:hypothetical protein
VRLPLSNGLVAAILFAALALAGCDDAMGPRVCTLVAVSALNVTVVDDVTATRLCDARVTALDGAFREDLPSWNPGTECTYSGPTERAGRYRVEVTRAGYQTEIAENIVVVADECHVIPVALTVRLKKS